MSGDKLDDAIDSAVREIMGTEPPAGLRQRVIRRLAEPERRARFAVPRLAFLTAVLLAVAVGAVVMLTMNRGRTSPPIEVAVAPPAFGTSRSSGCGSSGDAEHAFANRCTCHSAACGGRTGTPRRRPARKDRGGELSPRRRRHRRHFTARSASEDRPCTSELRRRPDGCDRNCTVAADGTPHDRAVVVNAALSGFEVRMLKQTVTTVAAATLLTVLSSRRQTRAEPGSTQRRNAHRRRPSNDPPQPAPARAPEGQPVNIRVGDHHHGSGRARRASQRRQLPWSWQTDRTSGIDQAERRPSPLRASLPVSINVDAYPTILKEGSIRLQFGLEYQPRPPPSRSGSKCRSFVPHVDAQRTDLP